MSATVEALVIAWRAAGAESRELFSNLFTNAWLLNKLLAVPANDPGFGRDMDVLLSPSSSAEELRAVLERYEDLATRYDGLPLETLVAVRGVEGIIPTWESLIQFSRTRNQALQGPIQNMAFVYAALARQSATSFGRALNDSAARVWLRARLERVYTAPESGSSGLFKGLVLLGILYVLGKGSQS